MASPRFRLHRFSTMAPLPDACCASVLRNATTRCSERPSGSSRSSMTRLILAAVLGVVLTTIGQAQAPRPLPDRATFFKATQDNLARAQREQGRYAYKERRTELHANPFGKIGTEGERVTAVRPGEEPGVIYRTLLEKDGVAVADAKPERQDRRDRSSSGSALTDVVNTLNLVMERRESRDGRDTIVVTFSPKPDAQPETREGRLAKIFTGTIWIDEAAREVARIEGTTIDSMTYGFGMVARLNKGTRVTVVQEPVDGGIWLPTSIRFSGEGRAMMFRKLNIDFAIDWFDYRLVNQK